jgi:sugar phosphate isomerase/epimerase
MYRALATGAIGIKASFEEQLQLAQQYGFKGVPFGTGTIDELGVDGVKALFDQYDILPAQCGLPVNFSGDEETYRKGLAALPEFVDNMTIIGCDRIGSGIMPCHDTRPYEENFAIVSERLGPICDILADEGLRLGLEFISPMTLRKSKRYQFIHDIDGMLALFDAVDADNLAVVLDAWHWYCAHNTLADLDKLSDNLITMVHVNDAPKGIPVDEQQDLVRELPATTGVIDIEGFMGKLSELEYSGPVMVEPFNARLNALPRDEALAEVKAALDRIWPEGE